MDEDSKNNIVTLVLGLVFIALLGLTVVWLVQSVITIANTPH